LAGWLPGVGRRGGWQTIDISLRFSKCETPNMFCSLNIEIHAAQAPALRVGFICNLMLEIWDFISSIILEA